MTTTITPHPTGFALAARRLAPSHPAPNLTWSAGNAARLFVDTGPTTAALVDAIRGARQVVDVSLFALHDSGSGRELANAMIDRARRGVEVNLVIDAVGCLLLPGTKNWRLVRELREAGVNVIVTSKLSPRRANRFVDHRKVVIADGRTAFVGGMNFSRMFADWHDTMVGFSGPAAAHAGQQFLARWADLGGAVSRRHASAVTLGVDAPGANARAGAAIVANSPDRDDFSLTDFHIDRIRRARRRIWIVSPFIGDREVVRELAAAAQRGVDVRVATSSKSTLPLVPFVPLFTRTFYRDLIDAGAKVYEIGVTTHAKAMIADDETTLGSYNISRRAGYHDHELNLVARDRAFGRQVEQLFEADFRRSRRFTRDDCERPMQRAFNAVVDALGIQY